MGPAWVPTNYLIFHGLRKYGFDAEAKELAGRTFRMALELNKVTREYYDSDTGHGNGMNPFWGWSALAYVMPLEFQESYNPMELKSKIRPFLSEAIGPFLRSPQRSSP